MHKCCCQLSVYFEKPNKFYTFIVVFISSSEFLQIILNYKTKDENKAKKLKARRELFKLFENKLLKQKNNCLENYILSLFVDIDDSRITLKFWLKEKCETVKTKC